MIANEETEHHKPFFDLEDTVDCKMKIFDPSASRIDHSTCVDLVFDLTVNFRISRMKFF